jgi:repressor LexA
MAVLTKKQKQVLDFIRAFIERHEYAPSYGEIAQGMGLSSVSNIQAHVENLVRKGYLTKRTNANRSMDLSSRGLPQEAAEVPLAGTIAAGEPIEAISGPETMALPPDMLGRTETYVLRVTGDSMVEDHVVDGDFVVVERRTQARNGEMVVALIRGAEATLKRYRRVDRKIVLEPANPRFEAQVYDEQDVTIQGVVIGILRKFNP